MYVSILRRVAIGASMIGLASVCGCFRSASGECNPFDPPPPYITPVVTTNASGTIAVTFDRVPAVVPLDGSENTGGPSCSAEINGDPASQTFSVVCTYPPVKDAQGEVVTRRHLSIGYSAFDPRQLAAGDTRAKITISEWNAGAGSGCDATLDGVITITDATGAAAAAPHYVTTDYVRKGTVTLDVDAANTHWTTSELDACAPPSLAIHLSATFTQLPADYSEVSQGSCNLDISK